MVNTFDLFPTFRHRIFLRAVCATTTTGPIASRDEQSRPRRRAPRPSLPHSARRRSAARPPGFFADRFARALRAPHRARANPRRVVCRPPSLHRTTPAAPRRLAFGCRARAPEQPPLVWLAALHRLLDRPPPRRAASLSAAALAREVYQHLAHRSRRRREEMSAVFQPRPIGVDQPQVGFVNERGGLHRP